MFIVLDKIFNCTFNLFTSNFQGLPKIHKSEKIKIAVVTQKSEYIEIPGPSDLKFRPIAPGPSCPINRHRKLID